MMDKGCGHETVSLLSHSISKPLTPGVCRRDDSSSIVSAVKVSKSLSLSPYHLSIHKNKLRWNCCETENKIHLKSIMQTCS